MGILVKIVDGKPVKQDYTKDDVITAIHNMAGPKPDDKKPQISFVVDQLKYMSVTGNSEIIKQQIIRILQDMSRDISEIGEFVNAKSIRT